MFRQDDWQSSKTGEFQAIFTSNPDSDEEGGRQDLLHGSKINLTLDVLRERTSIAIERNKKNKTQSHYATRKKYRHRILFKKRKRPLDLLLVIRGRVGLGMGMITPELEPVAFELFTIRYRAHRGSVLVQEVDLLEGQSLGLEQDVSFLKIATAVGQTSGTQK